MENNKEVVKELSEKIKPILMQRHRDFQDNISFENVKIYAYGNYEYIDRTTELIAKAIISSCYNKKNIKLMVVEQQYTHRSSCGCPTCDCARAYNQGTKDQLAHDMKEINGE